MASPCLDGAATTIVLVMTNRRTPARIAWSIRVPGRQQEPAVLDRRVAPQRAPGTRVADHVDAPHDHHPVPGIEQISDPPLAVEPGRQTQRNDDR